MAKQTFESAMKRLEQIVQEMESGDLPLEKATKKFEEGIRLSKFCTQKLDETEKKVTMLLKENESPIQMLSETDVSESADPEDDE